ncbi:3-hydroxyacyl-CoA dehydrogenase NAD-binding domain-containing protein [Terrabacter terrigena]|uniref:3-hydroxyacyl-CoA dehydrogenase NAD-binding domain-containing protein n=1 Tax=Terrabacter terrigena TaxID=574718 RepID=A0ABW3N495_9MICO
MGSTLATALTSAGHPVRWLSDSDQEPAGTGMRASVETIRGCDVVIECISEDRAAKISVLGELAGTSAAVLTTTSSFTVAELASESGLEGRLAGFHYLPSYGGKLVELTTAASDPDVRAAAAALADELGLATVEVADRPGRISRRLIVPFLENVLRAVELGIASPDDIDRVVHLGLGHAVGPLHRLGEAGLEDHRAVVKALLPTIPTAGR